MAFGCLDHKMPMDDPSCFACHGPYHPATGNHFAPGVDYCGRCYRGFLAFFRASVHPRRKGPDFYAEAATSVRPPMA